MFESKSDVLVTLTYVAIAGFIAYNTKKLYDLELRIANSRNKMAKDMEKLDESIRNIGK